MLLPNNIILLQNTLTTYSQQKMPTVLLWPIPSGTAALITAEPSSHSHALSKAQLEETGLVVIAFAQDYGRSDAILLARKVQSYLSPEVVSLLPRS